MVDQDFGLLQAVDERLAMYGWLTNTGVKFVIIVDMEGRPATALDSKASTAVGLRDADMKPASSFICSVVAFLLRCAGFQGITNGVHHAVAESFLQPGRALANHRKCGAKSRVNADHQPKVHSRSEENWRCMGAGNCKPLNLRRRHSES